MTSYKLNLNTMRQSRMSASYLLDDTFFGTKDYSLVSKGKISVSATVERKEEHFHLSLQLDGYVIDHCARCLDEVEVPIHTSAELTVKYGDAVGEEDDVVYVNESTGELDLEPLLYDFAMLAIPERPVHKDGECNPEMSARLGDILVN
jgi:uncharacterized metal-binding protein YceD (DUF177 family)